MAEEADDSDWEYEYHETETEDFFVTIDLSSFSTHIRPPKRGQEAKNSPTPVPKVPVPEFAASRSDLASQIDSSESIQILGLDSENPLISYKSQLYSCEWTTTLGTDILLAPSQAGEVSTSALRSLPGVDVVAATRIKLIASPTQAKPRTHAPQLVKAAQADPSPGHGGTSNRPEGSHPSVATSSGPIQAVDLPLGKNPSLARQKQGAFLGQLIALKQAQGETDKVPVIVATSRQRKGDPDSDDEDEASSERDNVGDINPDEMSVVANSPEVTKQLAARALQGSALSRELRYQEVPDQPAIGRTPGRWVDLDPSLGLGDTAVDRNMEQIGSGGPVEGAEARRGEGATQSLGSSRNEMERTARLSQGDADRPEVSADRLARTDASGDTSSMDGIAASGEIRAHDHSGDDRGAQDGDIEMGDA